MQWLTQNWVWVLFLGAFIAMHLFGHGGHGGDKDSASAGNHDSQSSSDHSGHHY